MRQGRRVLMQRPGRQLRTGQDRPAQKHALGRDGIEAGISCLKRAYGLARCTWRGLDHFRSYVWSSVVAYNLALLARLKPV